MRRRNWTVVSILSFVFLLACVQALPAGEATWNVGVSSTIITPDEAIWQAGYGKRDHPAEGKLHELWVKVLVLEAAGGERAVGHGEAGVGEVPDRRRDVGRGDVPLRLHRLYPARPR